MHQWMGETRKYIPPKMPVSQSLKSINFHGDSCYTDVTKDCHKQWLSWITWLGLMCPHKRETKGNSSTEQNFQ